MKHLIHFESISDRHRYQNDSKELDVGGIKPEVGDYVICQEVKDVGSNEIQDFIDTHIGKITGIDFFSQFPYEVEYEEKLPTNTRYRLFRRRELIHISKDKNDLEAYLSANKYNL